MKSNYYALILAGGGGTRLWPLSRRTQPKQTLPLVGEESMFKTSVERIAPLFPPENVFVVTAQQYVETLQKDAPDIPAQNFILEPYARDNAAATALAFSVIHKRDPKAVVAMLASDHHIGKPDKFIKVLDAAHEVASKDYIVTLGISPTFPSTGFGYIQQGDLLGEIDAFTYHEATRFTEKPDVVRATQFIRSGRYSWNSGMFIWTTQKAMREFERQQPEMYALIEQLLPAIDTPEYETVLGQIWEQMPKKSIDYAIMEGAEAIAVIPVDIGWSDVGSWASLYDVWTQDRFGNCASTDNMEKRILLDTRDTLVYSDKLTVTIGIDQIIVVETDDVLFICHKDRAQDVRQVVQYLRENGTDEYL
jgi:mannose-1-phosphate guanylyltransferase